nr:PAS domain S-box protein [Armatimonadota bacterium]
DFRWHCRKDGSRFWADGILTALRDEDGRLRGFCKVLRDATEQKLDEDKAAYLASLVETSDVAIISKDLDGTIRTWNRAAERLYGYTSEEAVGRPINFIIPPHRLTEFQNIMARLRRGEPTESIETERQAKDDKRVPIRLTVSPVRDKDGALVGASSLARSISRRREIEQALSLSEARLKFALAAADVGTWHWDIPSDALIWSDRCKAIFGLPPDAELSYDLFLERLHPDDREQADQAVMRAIDSQADYDIEFRCPQPDGSLRWVNSKGRAYYDSDDHPVRFEGIVQDVTERKRVEQDLQARVDREALLNRIGQILRVSQDPDEVQMKALAALAEGLGLDRCYFSTFDVEQDAVWTAPDWCRPDLPSVAGTFCLSDFSQSPNPLFPSDGALAIDDIHMAGASAKLVQALDALRIRAHISVPFFDRGKLVATLGVAMADAPRAWTQGEVSLVETVAAQIRAAVEAARVFRRERNIAASLQDALQPALPRHAPGLDLAFFYKAALEESYVGGDFADVFPLSEDCTVLVVADLSGKGLAAASQVSTVRNMLRSVLYLQPTLADALSKLNRVVTEQGLLSGFVTLLVATYEPNGRTLKYVSCGHEPGLLRRAASGEVEELMPTGPIFGADENAIYEEHSIALLPGDALLFYTDGLTEAGPSRLDFLGVAGLTELLRASDGGDVTSLVTDTISGVQTYAHGLLRDDACLLAAIVQ